MQTYFCYFIKFKSSNKPAVSGILFSISVAFVLRTALVVRLVMSGILVSNSAAFVFRAAFVVRLVISGIWFSISVPFVLRAAITKIQ